jgi:hypothetical protein
VKLKEGASRVVDVKCKCLHRFCFACGTEAHSPASCEMKTKVRCLSCERHARNIVMDILAPRLVMW